MALFEEKKIKNYQVFFPAVIFFLFFQFLVIKTLDQDWIRIQIGTFSA